MDAPKRILLVDDEEINLEFFEVMLGKLGFETAKANNGIDALELVKSFRPDLIILDNVMPRLSGWEVTKIIKTREDFKDLAETPIIMFSAMDDVKDKVDGLELGADDYITKPFNFSEVLARIHAVLRTRDLIKQIEDREARLDLGDRITSQLLSFVGGLRSPLMDLIERCNAASADPESARGLAKDLESKAMTALRDLDSLQDAVSSLQNQSDSLKQAETALKAIKTHYRGHPAR